MAISIYAQGPARVPAYPGIIERIQPNGDTLRVYLRGDERSHWMITEDGYQVMENDKGWIKYVKLNRKEEPVISWRRAHNEEDRGRCEKRWLKRHGVQHIYPPLKYDR